MASPPIQDLTGDDTPMETESGVPAPAETNFDGQDPYSLFINDPDDEAANDVDLTRVEPMTTNLDYASQFPAGVAPDQGEIIMTSALPTSETIEESDPNEVVITGNTTSSNNPQAGRALNAAWKEKLLARQRKYLKPDQIVDLSQETPQSLVNLTSAAPEAPMVPDEAQQEDLEAIQAEFTAAHKEYLRKQASGKLSDLDEVAFIKLQRQFQSKVKKAKEDLRCEVAELGGDAYMSGDDVNMTEVQPGAAQCAAEEGYQAFMSAEASNPLNAPGKGRSNTNANSKAKKGKAAKATAQATTSRGGKGTRGGRVAKPKRPTKKQLEQEKRSRNRTNMDNLFSQNLFRDVQTNTARDDGPTFSVNANATNKKQSALKQLVASIPTEGQQMAKIDKKQLNDALKHFTPSSSVQPDEGTQGWKMKGMKSSLSHYQMLGVSFMRERETAGIAPAGGILADAMGLGKTVMQIANIVNGYRRSQKNQTTLVVATQSLVFQWAQEFKLHAEANACGPVVRYHTGAALHGDAENLADTLALAGVVITTYEQVRKSYPKWQPDPSLVTAEAKAAWWHKHYEEHKGALHTLKFHRVVLDEAQAIKSAESQTSIAVRSLHAKYRWAMSGTPVQNRLEELFLRAPHTGSLRVFKENFCNKTEGADRLHLFLRQFMIRRTHNDSLFGSKLLSLKPPSKHDHKCHFSDIERAIYNVLHKRFVARINGFARTGQMKKQYSSVLTMILRLRQVVAHPLLVQDSLRDLLEPVDFAHLKQICDMPVQPHMTEYHILQHLRMMLDHDHRSLLVVEPLTPSRPGSILDTAMDLDGNLTAENQEIKEAPASSTLPPAVSENPEGTIEPTQPEQARDTEMIDEEAKPAESSSSNLQAANEPGTPAPQTREPPSVGGQFGLRNDYGDFFADLQLTSEINEVEDISTCTRCRQKPIEPHKTSCMHIYCRQCLMIMSNEAVAAGSGIMKCIACGNTFHGSALYTPTQTVKPSDARGSPVWDVDMTALKRERGVAVRGKGPAGKGADVVSHWVDGAGKMLPSAKTLAFKAQVANWLQEDPNVKIIVYTQFISMIQILGKVCEMEGWDFLTFHGSHDIVKRNKIVEEFRDKEDVKVLLSSLKTGGTGLNLVMASRVILIDLWWNTAVEDQAFARTYRRGQERETRLTRFIVANTIDDQICDMQRRKEQEIGSVMDNEAKMGKRISTEELLSLFGDVRQDRQGRPFIYVDEAQSTNRPPRFARQDDDESAEMGDSM